MLSKPSVHLLKVLLVTLSLFFAQVKQSFTFLFQMLQNQSQYLNQLHEQYVPRYEYEERLREIEDMKGAMKDLSTRVVELERQVSQPDQDTLAGRVAQTSQELISVNSLLEREDFVSSHAFGKVLDEHLALEGHVFDQLETGREERAQAFDCLDKLQASFVDLDEQQQVCLFCMLCSELLYCLNMSWPLCRACGTSWT